MNIRNLTSILLLTFAVLSLPAFAEGMGGKITEEQVDAFLDLIEQHDSDYADVLRNLRENDPEEFKKEIKIAYEFINKRADELRERFHAGEFGPDDRRRGREGMRDREGRKGRRRGGETEPNEEPRGRDEDMPFAGPDEMEKPSRGQMMKRWISRRMFSDENYLEWLEDNYPGEFEMLERLEDEAPEAYKRRLRYSRIKYGPIMAAEQQNPELAELLKEDLELKEVRDKLLEHLDDADKDDEKHIENIMEELEEVVSQRFEIIIRKKQFQYEAMRQRLERLEKQLSERQAEVDKLRDKKQAAVKQRMSELLGKSEQINWD